MSASGLSVDAGTQEFSLSLLQPQRMRTIELTVLNLMAETERNAISSSTAIRRLQSPELDRLPSDRVGHGTPPVVWYEPDLSMLEGPLSDLMGNVAIDADTAFPIAPRAGFVREYVEALLRFERELPETYRAFVRSIDFVILGQRPGYSGGTVSSRIGLIWLSPDDTWTVDTWLTNLVHEFVHNRLFMEDMVEGIFLAGGARLAESDCLAISAIRRTKRGYDKSYHSAFVAFTLFELERRLGSDTNGESLDALTICVDDLTTNTAFLAPRGRLLLIELAELVLNERARLGLA